MAEVETVNTIHVVNRNYHPTWKNGHATCKEESKTPGHWDGLKGMVAAYRALLDRAWSKGHEDRIALQHGDPCFSNVLFDKRTGLLKLIDPRGASERRTAFGRGCSGRWRWANRRTLRGKSRQRRWGWLPLGTHPFMNGGCH